MHGSLEQVSPQTCCVLHLWERLRDGDEDVCQYSFWLQQFIPRPFSGSGHYCNVARILQTVGNVVKVY